MSRAQLARGTVVAINGNLVSVKTTSGKPMQNEVAYVTCGAERLKAEAIRIEGDLVNLQVFEDTTGITVGVGVEFTGELLSATLAPGLLGMIFDGLQNPLKLLKNRQGFFLLRGESAPAIDPDRPWRFTPKQVVGNRVHAGSLLGSVKELHYEHHIMAPLGLRGVATIESIKPTGEYRLHDTVAVLRDDSGGRHLAALGQTWPVKRAIHAHARRLYPREMMVTGCRIIDTMFPVARGGTACVPGPFGAGKTVLQQLLSRYAAVDIVIVVACGERAGEVVETIIEFPDLTDPKRGGSLMDRTIIICNTSSMPVAASGRWRTSGNTSPTAS